MTLTRDAVIAYCNRRFADIVRTPLARVVGAPLRRPEHPPLERLEAARAHRPLPRERSVGDVRQRERIHGRMSAPFGVAMRGVFLAEAPVEIARRGVHGGANRWVVGSGR